MAQKKQDGKPDANDDEAMKEIRKELVRKEFFKYQNEINMISGVDKPTLKTDVIFNCFLHNSFKVLLHFIKNENC
jgi:hypothetical protein